MSAAHAVVLFLAGIAGGLCGSIAGLASLISYPALLAIGLPPVTANVTNTVSLTCSSLGSITGSRPELAGQRAHTTRIAAAAFVGGAAGGALLLLTPSGSFAKVVPWLLLAASGAILVRPPLRLVPAAGGQHRPGSPTLGAVVAVGVYAGYFGAGAGVMLLALLLYATGDTLPRANAVKNVSLGLANGIAAVSFALFGPVRWALVVPLGLGFLIGGRTGPVVVRHTPAGGLRVVIAVAGVGLAVKLGLDAYR